jgi:hypothetical protein
MRTKQMLSIQLSSLQMRAGQLKTAVKGADWQGHSDSNTQYVTGELERIIQRIDQIKEEFAA